MEKNKNIKVWIVLSVVLIIVVIAVYKANKKHEEKLYYVVHQKIKEAALNCYVEKKCEGKIKLQYLYEYKYLNDKIIDPVTKEEIDENICLNYIANVVDFCE